jgi:hypothetical protein
MPVFLIMGDRTNNHVGLHVFNCRHLLVSLRGFSRSLVMKDHWEVCSLSRGMIFQSLSISLQGGFRFFPFPLLAILRAFLAGCFPMFGKITSLPCFVHVTG